MARIILSIEDDEGKVISVERLQYELNLDDGRFSTLEGEVDRFKQRASHEITALLTATLQETFLEKKSTSGGDSMGGTK